MLLPEQNLDEPANILTWCKYPNGLKQREEIEYFVTDLTTKMVSYELLTGNGIDSKAN